MAASAATVGVAVMTLLLVFFCAMFAEFAYILTAPGAYKDCFTMGDRWMIAIVADFNMFTAAMGAWVAYKESSWIKAVAVMASMDALGCIGTCGYILPQFFKLSRAEFRKDPLYFVLAKQNKRDVNDQNQRPSVVSARIIYSTLGCFMFGVLVYTLIDDILSSPLEPFNKCIIPNITDIYFHVVIFSVWIAYKESNWISALSWILFLICFRGIATCAYIVRQLFYLSPQHSASLIIFNKSNMLQRIAVK